MKYVLILKPKIVPLEWFFGYNITFFEIVGSFCVIFILFSEPVEAFLTTFEKQPFSVSFEKTVTWAF